jgi:hypothetical protein
MNRAVAFVARLAGISYQRFSSLIEKRSLANNNNIRIIWFKLFYLM